MSNLTIGLIWLAFLFGLMFLRMPIGPAFITLAFFGIWMMRGFGASCESMAIVPYTIASNYAWTAIPPFVLMGYLALRVGIAGEFYDGVRRWIGHWPGGLAQSVILGNAAFGACSSNSMIASVTFTAMSLPEMRKHGYADTLSLGSILGGANLSLMIPPSAGFIVYGAITMTNIAALFIGGIFPGLLLAVLFMFLVAFMCWRNPALGPPGPRTTWREKLTAGTGMWAMIAVFVGIIGGLYIGLFTPTEAGAAGAALVFILGLIKRTLNWRTFRDACIDTGVVLGMTMFLIIGVMVFNRFLILTEVPLALAQFIAGINTSPTIIFLIIVFLFLILGMFIDVQAMILLMVPIFHPIMVSLGIDPIQLGVVVILTTAVGAISPPYGLVAYAIQAIVKDIPLTTVFRGVIPFIMVMAVCIIILVFVPEISTWLPSTM